MTQTPFNTIEDFKPGSTSRLSNLWEAADVYGQRSFDNYAQIRSVAETVRDTLCTWLHEGHGPCVFLVPPEGPFQAQNYQSGAFSVSGTGYLPLKPISFGLAIRISEAKDYMRLVMLCQKEGELMKISIADESPIALQLPLDEEKLTPLFERIYGHILHFFTASVEQYDEGEYGTATIGFDIVRPAE